MSSGISESSCSGSGSASNQQGNRDFKIKFGLKSGGTQVTVHLVAPSIQDKTAWISDISQCMDNVHDLLRCTLSDTSSVTMPQSMRNDSKLFKDDVDIKFSSTLNSCKVPQIRSATPERLLQRLTDLRFLSIDFLNTFLLTYRVFTDGVTVLEALKKVFHEADPPDAEMPFGSLVSLDVLAGTTSDAQLHVDDRRRSSVSPRRTSGASSVSGYGSEISDCREVKCHTSCDSSSGGYTLNSKGYWRNKKVDEEPQLGLISEAPSIIKRSPTMQSSTASTGSQSPATPRKINIRADKEKKEQDDGCHLTIPKVIAVSSSSETLTDNTVISAPSSPSNLSSVTLVGSTGSGSGSGSDRSPQDGATYSRGASEETDTCTPLATEPPKDDEQFSYDDSEPETPKLTKGEMPTKTPSTPKDKSVGTNGNESNKEEKEKQPVKEAEATSPLAQLQSSQQSQQKEQRQQYSQLNEHRASIASAPAATARSGSIPTITGNYWASRRSIQETEITSHQGYFQYDQVSSKPGVAITSFRQSQRRFVRVFLTCLSVYVHTLLYTS